MPPVVGVGSDVRSSILWINDLSRLYPSGENLRSGSGGRGDAGSQRRETVDGVDRPGGTHQAPWCRCAPRHANRVTLGLSPAPRARQPVPRDRGPLLAGDPAVGSKGSGKPSQPLPLLLRWRTSRQGGPISMSRSILTAAELTDPRPTSPAGLTLIPAVRRKAKSVPLLR